MLGKIASVGCPLIKIEYETVVIHTVIDKKLGCSQKRGEVLTPSLFRIMCGVATYFFVTKKKRKKEKDIHMVHDDARKSIRWNASDYGDGFST